jgi:hypothetical protein
MTVERIRSFAGAERRNADLEWHHRKIDSQPGVLAMGPDQLLVVGSHRKRIRRAANRLILLKGDAHRKRINSQGK